MTHTTDHILDTIDNVLGPHDQLPDAMIWSATSPDPTAPGTPPCGDLSGDAIQDFVRLGQEFSASFALVIDLHQLRAAIRLLCDTFVREWHTPGQIHEHNVLYIAATTGWSPQMIDRLWRLIFRGRLRNRYDRGPFSSPRPCPDMADYRRRTRARRKRRR